MFNSKTLNFYLFKLCLTSFVVISLIVAGLLFISNIFDVLQKFKSLYLPSHLFWKLSIYKIPYLLSELSPLISFISSLFFLQKMTKNNEFLIILVSGVQSWKIFLIPIITSFLLGVFTVAALNPIGAYGLMKYEYLEAKLTKKKQAGITITKNGISFFEQYKGTENLSNHISSKDFGNNQHYNRIIHAKSISVSSNQLNDVIILFIDQENQFIKRIDAKTAKIQNNQIILHNIRSFDSYNSYELEEIKLPTHLSMGNFTDSFMPPETFSIWNIQVTISKFLKSGLPVLHYQIYYYKQLFKPLMMIATSMIACCFVTLNNRKKSAKLVFATALIIGFAIYSIIEISSKILAYNQFDPILSILLPIILVMLISNFIILHLHEA